MMKHFHGKKAAVLLICAALTIPFAACGKDKKNTDTSAADAAQNAKAGNADTAETVSGKGGKTTWYTAADNGEDPDVTMTTTTTTVTTKKKTTTKKTTTTTVKTTTTTAKTTTTTAAAASPAKRDNSYKVSTKKYTSDDGKIKYSYPQITGLYDEDMQNFYNKLFKNDLKAAVDDIGKGTLTMTFDVKRKTKDQLSIVFYGGVFYDGAAHPYGYAYAYNIDLATGETFVPSEQISMDKAADAILADKWTLVGHAEGVSKSNIVDYFSQFDEEALKNSITESKVISVKRDDKGEYSVKGQTACRSYLDSDGEPVLILEVNHALGDYAEVKLS